MLDFISNWLIRVVGCFILVLFSVLAKAQNSESEIYQDPNQPAIDSVLALIHNDTPDSTKAVYYYYIGKISDNSDTILKYSLLSLSLCPKTDSLTIAYDYRYVAYAYYMLDEPNKALTYNYLAANLFKSINKYPKMTAMSYIGIANCYEDLNVQDSVFYYYDKALNIFIDVKDTANVSYVYRIIGESYYVMELYGAAEENYRKALDYALLSSDSVTIAFAYLNFGETHLFVSDTACFVSIDYLKKAVSLFESSDRIDGYYLSGKYGSYLAIAQAYIKAAEKTGENKYADSCLLFVNKSDSYMLSQGANVDYVNGRYVYVEYLLYYHRYHDVLNELHKLRKYIDDDVSYSFLMSYYDYLYRTYSYLGDYKNALRNLEIRDEYKFAVLNDSTLNVLKDAEISRTRMIEELKHENQEKEHATERERMKSHRNLLICIILSILIVLALVIRMLVIKRRANLVLHQQCSEVESVNNKLFSSIIYAQKIQNAAVPTESDVRMLFPDSFVFYRPCDIVSGDFYMAVRCGEFSVMITADCTGHGIPGAFLSMLGISALKEYMVTENDAANPSTVLDRMRSFIKSTLISQRGSLIDDGMDMTICCFNFATMRLHYAIANQTAFIIRNGSCIRLKGDKMPVGRYIRELDHFQSFEIDIQKGDMVYMFSDGIIDQLGGERQKKLLLNGLLDMLLAIAESPTDTQRNILEYKIDLWRGSIAQIDDMTVVGIRV